MSGWATRPPLLPFLLSGSPLPGAPRFDLVPPHTWAISQVRRNRLCHMLHGNTFTVCSFNVTSFSRYSRDVCKFAAAHTVVAMQETKLTQLLQQRVDADLVAQGWRAVYGAPQPPRTTLVDGQYGGVGIISKSSLEPWIPHRHGLGAFRHPKRLAVAAVPLFQGTHWMFVMSVYGYPYHHAQHNAEDTTRANQDLFQEVVSLVAAMGAAPVVVCGDFNVDTVSDPVLSQAISRGLLVDAAIHDGLVHHREPEPTCVQGETATRIDAILMNTAAASAFKQCRVCSETRIGRHRPLVLELDLQVYQMYVRALVRPPKLTTLKQAIVPSEAQAAWASVQQSFQICLCQACAAPGGAPSEVQRALNEAWRLLSGFMEDILRQRVPDGPAFQGRPKGSNPRFRKMPLAAAVSQKSHDGFFLQMDERASQLHRIANQVRDFRDQLAKHRKQGILAPPPHQVSPFKWAQLYHRAVRLKIPETVQRLWRQSAVEDCECPTHEVCQDIIQQLDKAAQWHRKEMARSRITSWKERMITSFDTTRAEVFQWLRRSGTFTMRAMHVKGQLTASSEAIHDHLKAEWSSIFRKLDSCAPAQWAVLYKRYGQQIDSAFVPCDLPPITAADVASAIKRWKSCSAPGTDGWYTAEWKLLPPAAHEPLAQLLNCIEDCATWPEATLHAAISLLPKPDGLDPGSAFSLRPITVLPVLYRLWSAIRFGQLHPWMEKALHHSVHGGRRRHETRLAVWRVALDIEHAILNDTPLAGASLDAEKFFDLIEWDIVFPVARAFGLPDNLLRPLRAYFSNCSRFFKLGQSCGPAWRATNGIFQGCSLSVLLVGLYTTLWAARLESQFPNLSASSFVDDRTLTTTSVQHMHQATQETFCFDQLCGGRPNNRKSKYWVAPPNVASSLRKRRFHMPEVIIIQPSAKRRRITPKTAAKDVHSIPIRVHAPELPLVSNFKLLGEQISLTKSRDYSLQNERAHAAAQVAERAANLPLPIEGRQSVCATAAASKYKFGLEFGPAAIAQVQSLTQAVKSAVWRRSPHFPLEELLFTLPFKGWLIHPRMQWIAESLSCFRRMMLAYPSLRQPLVRTRQAALELVAEVGLRDFGLISNLRRVIGVIGWSWPEPFLFVTDWGLQLPILTVDKALWDHEVRRGARRCLWQEIASRLPKYVDMARGIDTWATLRLFKSPKLTPYERGFLRTLFAGAQLPCGRLWRANVLCSPACPLCGCEMETLSHMLWQCPNHAELRRKFQARTGPIAELLDNWSSVECRLAGQLENREILQWRLALGPPQVTAQQEAASVLVHLSGTEAPPFPCANEGWTRVYTDGGCIRNDVPHLALAGAGVFFGVNHPANGSFPLRGPVQSNQRAELEAGLYALLVGPPNLEMITDSTTLHKGLLRLQGLNTEDEALPNDAHWIAVSHRDVWQAMWAQVRLRPKDSLRVRHVNSHLHASAVIAGCISPQDFAGNAAADELATAAIGRHRAPTLLIEAYLTQCDATEARQLLCIRTLQARSQNQDVHPNARTPQPLEGRDTSHLPCFTPVRHVESDVHEGTLRQEFVRIQPLPQLQVQEVAPEEPDDHSDNPARGPIESIMELHKESGQPTRRLLFQPLTAALVQEFRWGPRYLSAVLAFLSSMEWDVARPESTCTWMEIALDFESCMHMLLPPSGELTPKFDVIGRNTATILSRARTFHRMCLVLQRRLDKPSGSHQVFSDVKACCSLSHLGIRRSVGVKPRPILAAPYQVFAVLAKHANETASGTGFEEGGQSVRPSHLGRVTEWIPQPADQLMPTQHRSAQVDAMQQAQPAILARLQEIARQSPAASSAEIHRKRGAEQWDAEREQHNARGPGSGLHLLRTEYGHLEQQHCALCHAVYEHHNRAKALSDECPRFQLPGFEQAWRDHETAFASRQDATEFAPHCYAGRPVQELNLSEPARSVMRDAADVPLPVQSRWDGMTLQEFAAEFPVRGCSFRAKLNGVWRAHQHNMKAPCASAHVLELGAYLNDARQIKCAVCRSTTERKHLDRFKRQTCPQAEQSDYRTKWEASLKSIDGVVSKLHRAAPD